MERKDIERLKKETEEWLDLYGQLFDIIDELEKRYEQTKSEIDKKILQEWLAEKKAYDRLIEEFSVFTNPLKNRVDDYLFMSKKIDEDLESDEIYSNSRDASISDLYNDLQDKITSDYFVNDHQKLESINSLIELIEDTATEDYKQIEENGIMKKIPTKHLEKYEKLSELRKQITDNTIVPTDDLLQSLSDISLNNNDETELEILQLEEIDKNDNEQLENKSDVPVEDLEGNESEDKLYDEIVHFVKEKGSASITLIQKQFHIGHKKASKYIKLLEENGIVGPSQGRKPREVLTSEKKETQKNTECVVDDYHIGDDVFGSDSNTSDDSFELLDDSIQSILDTETLFNDSDKADRFNKALNALFDKGETSFEITKTIGETEDNLDEENPVKFKIDVSNRESVFSKVKGLTRSGLNKIKNLSKKAISGIRNNFINKKKRVVVVCGAIGLAAITVGSVFAFKGCSTNNDKKESNENATGITIETLPKKTTTGSKKTIGNGSPEKKTTKKIKSSTKVNPKYTKVLFGKRVKITTGSPIYTNAYDASNETNGKTPYYSYNTFNDVVGIVLESNNNIASFVSVDNGQIYEFRSNGQVMYLTSKEAITKVKELESKGYLKTAVPVKNANVNSGVTGFYNIDSVKVKTK